MMTRKIFSLLIAAIFMTAGLNAEEKSDKDSSSFEAAAEPAKKSDSKTGSETKNEEAAPAKKAAEAEKSADKKKKKPKSNKITSLEQLPELIPRMKPDEEIVENNFEMEVRQLENQINNLKENIYQSKSKLLQLQEMVINNYVTGAKAIVVVKDNLGEWFRLARLSVSVDGSVIVKNDPLSLLDKNRELIVFNQQLAPGKHSLVVSLEYMGNGGKLFPYINGLRFRVKANKSFDAADGKVTQIKAIAYESGGFFTRIEQRPALDFKVSVKRASFAGDSKRPAKEIKAPKKKSKPAGENKS